MAHEVFLNGKIGLCCGDSIHFLKDQPAGRYDSVVTDPPYALVSISKRFGAEGAAAVKVPEGGSGVYARASAGFMGKKWDTGETAFATEFWAEVFRVLKPGGHVAAFGGTRTYHRLACAIEDAGFEIRDSLCWLYGTGFPKSHDTGDAIDWKIAGPWCDDDEMARGPVSHSAAYWEGWGTALKPAFEPIVLARKPLSEPTVAANVLRWRTGALNIDGCRVATDEAIAPFGSPKQSAGGIMNGTDTPRAQFIQNAQGRWPANVVTDGSGEVVAMFPSEAGAFAPVRHGDTGSAARFFYTAKADSDDRLGSKHPTVKPVDLIQWLVRLITPKGGLVLDPFAGTGTTAEACFREGMRCMLVEWETEYQADIRRRMALVLGGPEERRREAIKAKTKNQPVDVGPLFARFHTEQNVGEPK